MNMRRLTNKLMAFGLILLLSLVMSFVWLASTESGLRYLYQQAQRQLPAELSIEKIDGRLLGPIKLNGVRYRQNGGQINAEQLTLAWQPAALLSGELVISRLQLQSINVELAEPEPSDQQSSTTDTNLSDFRLPFHLLLQDVVLDDISITQGERNIKLTQIKMAASSDDHGLQFETLQIKIAGGEITAHGKLSWSPQWSWQAALTASHINPEIILPDWPGNLNAEIISKGRTENGELIADAEISSLSGELRGYPLSLRSQMGWRDAGLDVHQFELRSGSSRINIQGRAAETLKLNWEIASSDLAELYPQAQGELQASGQLSGPQATPVINAILSAKTLSLPGYVIGDINSKIALDLFSWQQIDIRLLAKNLTLNNYELASLEINADTQNLMMTAVAEQVRTRIELKGEATTQGWRGHINRADITSRQFSDWHLKKPAALSIDKDSLLLEQLCWQQQISELCAAVERNQAQWQAQLEIQKLPLMLFGQWLPPDLKLDGNADAKAEIEFLAPEQLRAKAQIELAPGAVNYPLLEGELERKEYRGGTVNLTLDHKGLDANASLTMSNDDQFQAQLSLPGANLLVFDHNRQPLNAKAQLTLNDLSIIEALVPEIYKFKGVANLTISADGTLAKPHLSGQANLLNGSLLIPRLNLSIDLIKLNGQIDGMEKFTFKLGARSGDGQLSILGETRLDGANGWPSTITIKGDEFKVSNIAEAQVLVSPDLQIKITRRNIDINGEVKIPYAKLQPRDITTAARVSDDVVIVGGEQATEEKWLVSTNVRVTLGERVTFYGFGFDGTLGGSLILKDRPGEITSAVGEIKVNKGNYSAYGQNLDVEHGRLLYTGGPLTNPGLDLRAVRHINEITAGLKVLGSFNQPQIEIFSIPAMGQTDAFSYLLLGRPLRTASGDEGNMMAKAALALSLSGGDHLARTLADEFGLDEMRVESSDTGDQASLVMGRYLSPKLYISYGIGLIEAFNTFNVRYQISSKWQLKGESGEHQGADLLYTIER